MSFLLDPPVLFISGLVTGRFVPKGSRRRRIAIALLGLFYGVSGLLYVDILPWWNGRRWTRGSDWLLNSGLNTRLTRTAGADVLAVMLFAAYPLWLWFGMELGRQARPPEETVETTTGAGGATTVVTEEGATEDTEVEEAETVEPDTEEPDSEESDTGEPDPEEADTDENGTE